ncbi:ABC transporter ATP-binding protein [Siminovitchia terrae]|uniref:ABC transporter ATP-binding protein n=1 Tax=Siminovitchia terrae TaxID=1914933 RepID=A0A429X5U9_SIMTE|nr:ABC transporter ATP-binding protein [Siminovitchia terrae]RST58661.1 ABC transporter ATP-binding protein [Siminovitchia terrae]GIN92671.1 ABC transporter ATP-binding protein [Siminovitchia terrae]GIN96194.1 ABC transporter ATP-binding protein [Siminovitchia terrae]
MTYIVKTTNLTKQFDKHTAVSSVDLKIKEGEIYGFLGPNGAGKSTTIRMLLGLMKPTAGDIRIFNQDLKKHRKDILKQVGSLVENPSYYPHLTAKENLEVLRKVLKVPEKRISDVLEMVRLSHVADKKVKGFSLGMKQRLGIAQALLHEPKLLVLDEPTNGLDPEGIIEMRSLIKDLAKDGTTIVISSHLLSEIDQIATTIGVIAKGKLIYQDDIQTMRTLAKRRLRMRVSDTQQAQQIIGGKIEGKWLYCESRADEEVADAIQILTEQHIAIYRVEEEQRSLEAIFLRMIEEAS